VETDLYVDQIRERLHIRAYPNTPVGSAWRMRMGSGHVEDEPTKLTSLTGLISSALEDDSRTDAASALPLTRSDRRAGGIPDSDHRGRLGLSCAAAVLPELSSIRLCRSGSLLP
jgi:hypothetical protein